MNRYCRIFAVVVGACSMVPASVQAAEEPGQHGRTFEKQVPVRLDYLLFLPRGYPQEQGKKWPLIVFLHGSGERGTDVNAVKKHGPPKIVEGKPEFEFIA